jgi:hypothetical protein
MPDKSEELTAINNDEHNHPFFGTKLNAHKSIFNSWMANGIFKKNPSFQPLFSKYRENIIAGLNDEAALDRRGEGAECSMNFFPSQDECDKVRKDIDALDEMQKRLVGSIKI